VSEKLHVVGAAILRSGACLLAQRGPQRAEPWKWEFPGGKVEDGESPRAALAREIREELDLEIAVGDLLGRGESSTGGRRIVLDVYTAEIVAGEVRLIEHHRWGWFRAGDLAELDWAEADRPIVGELERRLCQADRHPRA
jgi:8-oxo-dGTP diphosphatase